MKKRIAVRWGIAAGALAAALGHFAYWYLPRERTGPPPSADGFELLADPEAGTAVWVAYPHQNLGRLERFVGDVATWVTVVAGRDRSEAEDLPRFGPFVAPPSSELAVAIDGTAQSPRAVVRAYPTVSLVARAAGRLAGNPWLAGGALEDGSGAVEWDGDLWRLGRRSAERPPFEPASGEGSPLALYRTAASFGPMPPGTYRLLRGEDGLELRMGERLGARPELPAGDDRPALLLIERDERLRHLSMILVWEDDGIAPPFPAAASVVRRGTPRPKLPGEDLLRLAGRKPKRATVEGLEVSGLSNREVERAKGLVPELLALASKQPGTRTVAIVDPAAVLRVTRRLEDGFAAFPLAALVDLDPTRWRELLAPWEECGPLALVVAKRGEAARVWLCPAAPVAARPGGA